MPDVMTRTKLVSLPVDAEGSSTALLSRLQAETTP